ncbi:hypothetical protein HNR60_003839 [Rhodopseudomonas rhenobacensis]|uniref:DUF1289 domain-containing protein n=1 Tax=Rhodopseudomonas rhenobacensis TaxID=87461 RepID=A0A7W7Z761_9BRAD|nr:DUF1289 domain-containing protein [Rhodopseudomonas rhenobacensis]MBB5049065.1 hypothetical protein [Rhodopseudomonas rhenobacensis]
MSKASPCVAVCIIDPDSNLCMGCGRTIVEITGWRRLDDAARDAIMAALPDRLIETGLRPRPPAEPALAPDVNR